eukprot:gene9726-11942_t
MAPKKILLIVGDYVEDYEAFVPTQMLQLVGHKVDVVSPSKKSGDHCISAVHDFLPGEQTYTELRGHRIAINANFDDVDASNYDGLFLPGGRAPEFLRLNEKVIKIVQDFHKSKKPIATVCHGPQILTAAGIVKGCQLTGYPACRPELVLAGAGFVDVGYEKMVYDQENNIVSGAAWPAHPAILSKFLELLGTVIKP